MSLPSRERELKQKNIDCQYFRPRVAPLAGARIETNSSAKYFAAYVVAPLAGARIETAPPCGKYPNVPVAPLAGARIETVLIQAKIEGLRVAPLAGARIETQPCLGGQLGIECRSPRGSAN